MSSEQEQTFHRRVVERLARRVGQLEIDLAVAKATEEALRETLAELDPPAPQTTHNEDLKEEP